MQITGLIKMKNKKASAVVIILVVSILLVSSGVIITQEIKKSSEVTGTGLVLLDNEKENPDSLSDSSGDGTKLFTFGDSGGKSSSKKKSGSRGLSSNTGSSNIIETPETIIEITDNETSENQTLVNDTEEDLNSSESVNVSNESTESQQGAMVEGQCKPDSKETDEGPGGRYCTYDDYEECYDYKTESTVIAYSWNLARGFYEKERGTDYCSDANTLQEAYLNCGLTLWLGDSLKWREKDCNDFDNTFDNYYCTNNEVRKQVRKNDYSCGGGECNSRQTVLSDIVISKKGDGNYCSKRKEGVDKEWYNCRLCGYEDYDCDSNSQCYGNLECKGPILDLNPSYYDGCCRSDEDWDSNTKRCVAQQECTSGVCCDGYYYRPSNYVCDNHYGSYYYDCPTGQCLGSDVKKQDRKRYCSGSSSSCNGAIEWNSWQVHDSCTSNEFCDSSNAGYNSPFSCSQTQCTSGMCCDTDCGEYSFLNPTNTCAYSLDYGCPNGEGVSNPGADVYMRTKPISCSGSSSACDGNEGNWGSWSLYDSCTSDQYCTDDDATCNSCGTHTTSNCYSDDVYWYDNCNNREDKKEECGTLGCSGGSCVPEIECYSDSDCGIDGYVGEKFCSSEDVYQSYMVYSCNNPGTTSSYCSSGDADILIEDCGEDSYGSNYCSGNDVYSDFTDRGCSSGSCFENTESQLIEACGEELCVGGVCEPLERPDLTITDLAVQSINGKTVVLAFTIKNIGELATADVYWMVDTDSTDENPERTIPVSLDPGSWTRAYMMWTYSQSGTYQPEAVVDSDNLILESDENNNKESISLVV